MSCIEPMVRLSVNSGTLQIDTVRTVTLNTVTLQNVIVNLISTSTQIYILNTLIVFLRIGISDMGMMRIRVPNDVGILS